MEKYVTCNRSNSAQPFCEINHNKTFLVEAGSIRKIVTVKEINCFISTIIFADFINNNINHPFHSFLKNKAPNVKTLVTDAYYIQEIKRVIKLQETPCCTVQSDISIPMLSSYVVVSKQIQIQYSFLKHNSKTA